MARRRLLLLFLICWIMSSPPNLEAAPRLSNQAVAEKIASALRKANLKGARDVAIEFQAGHATLAGHVADANQKRIAEEVTAGVEQVTKVTNLLKATSEPDAKPHAGTKDDQNSRDSPSLAAEESSLILPASFDLVRDVVQRRMAETYCRIGNRILDRQKQLFEADVIRRIEVKTIYKDKSIPLYDIYCGKNRVAILSRSDGSNFASFEGRFYNSFQPGLYKWKPDEKTGTQFTCTEEGLVRFQYYSLDPGGFMTSLYQGHEINPELFNAPLERKGGVKELRLKKPLYGMLSISILEDPLWFHELARQNEAGVVYKTVYSKPTEVDAVPESISQALKTVTFTPSSRSIGSLMPYP